MRILKLFEEFKKEEEVMEKYDLNKLNDLELLGVKSELVSTLRKLKDFILTHIEYNLKTNKIVYRKGFDNIDTELLLLDLNEDFGEDIIRELNIESV